MTYEEEIVDMDKLEKDVVELKTEMKIAQSDIHNLKLSDARQNERLKMVEKTLDSIQDDTKWIRRTITGAVITVLVSGIATAIITL